jgi:tRNA acetyltransferase TAN1
MLKGDARTFEALLSKLVVNALTYYDTARPEAEKVFVAEACTRADPEEIARAAAAIAPRYIKPENTFAVRTVRRGRHSFTSIDVNVVVGDAVRRATGASVNLRFPDWVVGVEIVHDEAYVVFYPGEKEWKKMRPGKYPLYKLFRRISVVQMPYLGPLDACRTMGVRIGREVQNFEVRELVIAPIGLTPADQLGKFIEGVYDGIDSRFEVQRKIYSRDVHKVPVYVEDLYQVVRDRLGEPLIVFEPEGDPVIDRRDDILRIFGGGARRVNIFIGSREGIPVGIYRFADLVLDLAPEITISTDLAAASAIIALATVLQGGEP